MRALLWMLGAWGVADAVWAVTAPERWSGFWARFLRQVGHRPWASRAVGAAELGVCLALLLAPRRAGGAVPAAPGLLRGGLATA